MWNYIILGVIQGIFEWIPISSEGIVALVSQFFITEINPIDVALFLHFGTLFSVLVYFRKDWKEVLMLRNSRLLKFLIISTLVSLIIGYPLYRVVKNIAIGNTLLVIMGFALLLTAFFQKKKKAPKMGFNKLALISGFLQGLAVIPGLSRSGSTIFGLSFRKIEPQNILKFSYMMSVPAIFASSAYLAFQNPSLASDGWPSLIFSFLVGLLSLHFLLNLAKRTNFFKFALLFGLLCLLGAVVSFMI